MKRSTCAACGHSELDQFLDLGSSPIADAYTATPNEAVPTFPLEVAVCAKCRLVQLLEVVPAEILFGTGYSFYSSASAPLSAYHKAYARDVLARYPDQARRGVVEVGSNDGDLLRHFAAHPHLGVDPSTGPALAAAERGCRVRIRQFDIDVAEEICNERGPAGLVIANHVLAHVEDVSDVLAGIAHLMDDDSVAMVEVQYLPDLLVNNAFDLVYHEHRNFFSLTSLEHAANRHGLFVIDAELTDRQGGSLRVTLARPYQIAKVADRVIGLRRSEMWLNDFSAYAGMQGRAERIRTRLLDLLGQQEGITAVYGAPAKATTLLNFCGLTSDDLPWCVDTTPAKQGRHIPGTGIPIVSPDHMGASTYLLTAWNYARPIIARNRDRQWIVPFPAPVLW
jgi:novobiocin biosynthesis protein NovU/D-mycarose 3-C-methyltransferase